MIKKSLVLGTLILILLSGTSFVFANNYMGLYLDRTATTSSKVIFECNFGGTNPNLIPDGNYLKAVISVAGSLGGAITSDGYCYQGPLELSHAGSVYYAPQYYFATTGTTIGVWNVGSYTYPLFYSKIYFDTGAGRIYYKCYTYPNTQAIERDTPTITTTYQTIPAGTTAFLVGTTTHNNHSYHFLQTGMENSAPMTVSWQAYNDRIGYWTGTAWRFEPGYVNWYTSSYISWVGLNGEYGVGSANWSGVNKGTSQADMVRWQYTGTTINDNTQLWSTGGVPSTPPSYPFS